MNTMQRRDADDIEHLIRQEVPGLRFRLERPSNTHLLQLIFERRVDGMKVAIDDLTVYTSNGEALGYAARTAISDLRQKAIEDYGLKKEIERQIEEAKRQARIEQRKIWLKWIDDQRERRVMDGPEGPVEVRMPLPYPLQQFQEMLRGEK